MKLRIVDLGKIERKIDSLLEQARQDYKFALEQSARYEETIHGLHKQLNAVKPNLLGDFLYHMAKNKIELTADRHEWGATHTAYFDISFYPETKDFDFDLTLGSRKLAVDPRKRQQLINLVRQFECHGWEPDGAGWRFKLTKRFGAESIGKFAEQITQAQERLLQLIGELNHLEALRGISESKDVSMQAPEGAGRDDGK